MSRGTTEFSWHLLRYKILSTAAIQRLLSVNAYCSIKQDKASFPLGREHLEAISELKTNKEIVITRPDKGAGVVLMNTVNYVDKMMDILNDTSKFELIGPCDTHDKTAWNEKALQAVLYRQLKDNKLGEDVYKRVRPLGSVRPRMYGLPKIHKSEPIPLRPILSLAGSAQHELARWLAEQLQPVLDYFSSHCVQNFLPFVTSYVNKISLGIRLSCVRLM